MSAYIAEYDNQTFDLDFTEEGKYTEKVKREENQMDHPSMDVPVDVNIKNQIVFY